MSTTTSNGGREAVRSASAPASPASKKSRLRHTPGGVKLGQEAGREAQRLSAAILEVLAGVRTPAQAAEALGLSLQRYFQLETRAVQGLVSACEPRPRGPGRSADKELIRLKRQHERLQRELSRQQTLVRLAQRSIGLAPPRLAVAQSPGKDKRKKRPRRPVARALRAAEVLQRRAQQVPSQETAAAGQPPPGQEPTEG